MSTLDVRHSPFGACTICGCYGECISREPGERPESTPLPTNFLQANGRHSTGTISPSPIDGLLVCEDCSVIQLQRLGFTPHEAHGPELTSSCPSCFGDAYELWHSEDERTECREECSQCNQLEDSLDLRRLAIEVAAEKRLPWPFSEDWLESSGSTQ